MPPFVRKRNPPTLFFALLRLLYTMLRAVFCSFAMFHLARRSLCRALIPIPINAHRRERNTPCNCAHKGCNRSRKLTLSLSHPPARHEKSSSWWQLDRIFLRNCMPAPKILLSQTAAFFRLRRVRAHFN